ncbi:MAG: hypothetical protein U0Z44_12210 [Kouleothrix sp.]
MRGAVAQQRHCASLTIGMRIERLASATSAQFTGRSLSLLAVIVTSR